MNSSNLIIHNNVNILGLH